MKCTPRKLYIKGWMYCTCKITPWHGQITVADMVRCKPLSICCLLTTHTTYRDPHCSRSQLRFFVATNATAEYSVVGQTRTQRNAALKSKKKSSWLKRAFLAGLAFSDGKSALRIAEPAWTRSRPKPRAIRASPTASNGLFGCMYLLGPGSSDACIVRRARPRSCKLPLPVWLWGNENESRFPSAWLARAHAASARDSPWCDGARICAQPNSCS